MSDCVYVIAGNLQEFRSYVNKKASEIKDLNVSINREGVYHVGNNTSYTTYVYVTHLDSIRGLRPIHGVFVGTYYKRSDIYDIITFISVANGEDVFDKLPKDKRDMIRDIIDITNVKVVTPPNAWDTMDTTFNSLFTDEYITTSTPPFLNLPALSLNVIPPLNPSSVFTIKPQPSSPFITDISVSVTKAAENIPKDDNES